MPQPSKLRELLAGPNIVIAPGAHDVLSAKLIEQAGFPAIFTSGFGLSASALGMPDVGLLTMTESLDRVRRIVEATSVPVIADMDTGYGNPLNVVRTVSECIRLGAAGVILEDQLWPKKCGHMEGKQVIPMDEYVKKVQAAVYARGSDDLVIIARTDAIAPVGFDDAIRRGQAYAEAGADVVFIEALQSMEQMRTVAEAFEVPLLANMVEGGKTPFLAAHELQALGFKLAIFPLSGLFAATRAMQDILAFLKGNGTTSGYESMTSFSQFEEVIGLENFREIESLFASS